MKKSLGKLTCQGDVSDLGRQVERVSCTPLTSGSHSLSVGQ